MLCHLDNVRVIWTQPAEPLASSAGGEPVVRQIMCTFWGLSGLPKVFSTCTSITELWCPLSPSAWWAGPEYGCEFAVVPFPFYFCQFPMHNFESALVSSRFDLCPLSHSQGVDLDGEADLLQDWLYTNNHYDVMVGFNYSGRASISVHILLWNWNCFKRVLWNCFTEIFTETVSSIHLVEEHKIHIIL